MKRFALLVILLSLVLLANSAIADQQITLTFWKFAAPPDDPIIEKYVNLWNETHPDVQVKFVTMPWADYTGTALPASFASGEAPDIFWLSPGDLLRYVNEEILLPLNDFVTEEELADLLPEARKRPTVEGTLYGLPVEIEPIAIFYNASLFKESGLGVPKSFEALLNAAEKLKTKDRYSIIIDPVPSYYQVFTWYPFLWGAGADVMSPDWKKATMDTEGAVAALKIWGDFIQKEYSPSTLPMPAGSIDPLVTGLGAMQLVGMWVLSALEQNPPDFEVGIFPVPGLREDMPPASVFGGWNFVINSKTRYPKEATEFCRWIIFKSDFLKEFCTDRVSKLPSRVSVLEAGRESFSRNPLAIEFIEKVLPIARPEPRYPTDVVKIIMDTLSFVMFTGLDPEEAARSANAQIQAYLDTYKGRIGAYE